MSNWVRQFKVVKYIDPDFDYTSIRDDEYWRIIIHPNIEYVPYNCFSCNENAEVQIREIILDHPYLRK